jgi:UDP-N-acetylmuramate dehydrogenase
LTTFRLGGAVGRLDDCHSEAALIEAVDRADRERRRLLVLGGGSNLVAGQDLADLVAVRDRRGGARAWVEDGRVRLAAAGGASWDALVAWTIDQGWAALAPLSGIPGSVGALPVQNVGAYGAAASDVVTGVRAYDREQRQVVFLETADLGFDYRDSALKRSIPGGGGITPRWVVLEVVFDLGEAPPGAAQFRPADPRLPQDRVSAVKAGASAVAVAYDQLAAALGVATGAAAAGPAVRQAVLAIRRGKGMVLDPDDHDTWSAGSYFTNPVVAPAVAAALPPDAPRFAAGADGGVKTSAAWLMTAAGVERGRGLDTQARAATSSKHVLALTNRGGATADDVLALERWIVARVRQRFGVVLEREPILVA